MAWLSACADDAASVDDASVDAAEDAARDAAPPPSDPYTCITAPDVDLSERAPAMWDGNPSDFDMAVEAAVTPADIAERPAVFEMGVQTER